MEHWRKKKHGQLRLLGVYIKNVLPYSSETLWPATINKNRKDNYGYMAQANNFNRLGRMPTYVMAWKQFRNPWRKNTNTYIHKAMFCA